jgi:hypothetical protein
MGKNKNRGPSSNFVPARGSNLGETVRINVTLSKSDELSLKDAARDRGLSVAAMARMLILRGLRHGF